MPDQHLATNFTASDQKGNFLLTRRGKRRFLMISLLERKQSPRICTEINDTDEKYII